MYIIIDENRFRIIVLSGYSGKNNLSAIKVDCDTPSKYHVLKTDYKKYSGESQWRISTTNETKEKLLTELLTIFNLETEQIIINNEIIYSNNNGTISITTDKITQQNFTALYVTRDIQTYPYIIWEKNISLIIDNANQISDVCLMVLNSVEEIRRHRKDIRDTFYEMTNSQLYETLKNYK